jgi:hypothetical protein
MNIIQQHQQVVTGISIGTASLIANKIASQGLVLVIFTCLMGLSNFARSEEQANPKASDEITYGKPRPDKGLIQRYIDFGEEKTVIDSFRFSQITRTTLTAMIEDHPDRKVFWLQTHKWGKGIHGKNITHQKLIYFRESKQLIYRQKQELDFESPQHHETWHEWACWKNIEPKQWEKRIPFEENEFKSDYNPKTAKQSFIWKFPDFPGLTEWP